VPTKGHDEYRHMHRSVGTVPAQLYVHQRLLQGQPAEDVFAHLFAKQRVVLPT
jgi:hypothetical protein